MNSKEILFMHQLNDGGLLFLNHYLEEKCRCNVFHISPTNRIIYDGEDLPYVTSLKERIVKKDAEKDFSYDEDTRVMIIRYHVNELRNLFVLYPVEESQIDRVLSELNKIEVAVNYYLKGLYTSFTQYQVLLKEKPEKIFQKDREYWEKFCMAHDIGLEEPARVVIYQPKSDSDQLVKLRRTVSHLSVRDGGSDVLTYLYNNRIVSIIPGRYTPKSVKLNNIFFS